MQEAANVAVDKLAGWAWDGEFDAVQPRQIAPHYHHSMVLQTLLPDKSISSNLAHTISEAITTIRGKMQLQQTLKMADDCMALIDEEITARNVSKFGKNSIARAHLSKQYTQQWHTEERSHKFDDRISGMCRCCDSREDEIILHILRCSSRKEVHTEHDQLFVQQMREIEAPNHLLHLFEAGIELALSNRYA